MGYRIVYGKDPAPKYEAAARLRVMTAVCMLVFVLLVRWISPEGTELLRRALEPRAETVSAFSDMVTRINGGDRVGEAVTTFCRTVARG